MYECDAIIRQEEQKNLLLFWIEHTLGAITHSMFWHAVDAGAGVFLIAFIATWIIRAYLPFSIHGNLCWFMIPGRVEHTLILLCPVGDSSGWTSRGRHTGDHPWHEPWSGLLGHGGQCGGSRGEVYPCTRWLHHCWTVSHTNKTSITIISQKYFEEIDSIKLTQSSSQCNMKPF